MTERIVRHLKGLTPETVEEAAQKHIALGDVEASLYIGWARGTNSRLCYKPSCVATLFEPESVGQLWLKEQETEGLEMTQKLIGQGRLTLVNTDHQDYEAWLNERPSSPDPLKLKTINILGLGDVGSTMALALCLYGKGVVGEIGLYDISPERQQRWEMELNQISEPLVDGLPKVRMIQASELFNCDLFAFTASVGVPPLSVKSGDVRAVQFDGNAKLLDKFVQMAVEQDFKGLFTVVSDPVDQLCRFAFKANRKHSEALGKKGLSPERIRGFGLGVMNGRAQYFAKQLGVSYGANGRVFGPHGQGLVVANDHSPALYDEALSEVLTEKTITANLAMRELGHKPYVAPAVASGAIAIVKTLSADWHYSCVSFNGFYYGCLNKWVQGEVVLEALRLPETLINRIVASAEAQEVQWQSFW